MHVYDLGYGSQISSKSLEMIFGMKVHLHPRFLEEEVGDHHLPSHRQGRDQSKLER